MVSKKQKDRRPALAQKEKELSNQETSADSVAEGFGGLSLNDNDARASNTTADGGQTELSHCFQSGIADGGVPLRYFEGDQSFAPNNSARFVHEFNRFANMKGWTGKKRRAEKRKACTQEFHHLIENYLSINNQRAGAEDLQNLCIALDINPPPESKTKCKQAIKRVHVNIYDFVDCMRTDIIPVNPIFTNRTKFLDRTIGKDLIYPRDSAKGHYVLRLLLENVFS